MMSKRRAGKPTRRRLEFDVIRHHVKRDKAGFIARMQRNCMSYGSCVLWTGSTDACGYGRMNFRYQGKHVSIHAHRVTLILMLARPLGPGMESGHLPECRDHSCIKHVVEQHWKDNLDQENGKCPF